MACYRLKASLALAWVLCLCLALYLNRSGFMSEFHFLRPFWLLALLPLAWLSWRLYRQGREGGDWRRVCDPALLPYMLIHDPGGAPAKRASSWVSLGGLLAVLALAGPVWERVPTPAVRNEAALVIALDLSRIMEAADLKPSRIERARFKIADILKQRKDGLTALLVYSGDAFTVTPLTDDVATISAQLSALSSDLMPLQGSRTEKALELAGKLLQQAGLTHGDVLLITNGGSLGKADEAAKTLRSQGYRVSVLGAGGEEGAPVPLPEGGFLQDSKGNIVISKLAAPALRQLAEQGGGVYRKLATDNSDIAALTGLFEQQTEAGKEGSTEHGAAIEQWQEQGPWLLLPLLPIAALAFRRGLLVWAFLLVLPMAKPAQALSWQDLWQTRDQQARQPLDAGDAAKAAEMFDDPAWKAAAQYKAGQYEEAAKTLQGQESADARYNLGNALAKQGQYPEAIAAYDQALKLNPQHEDARYNKELVEKALQDQQKQQQKQDKNQSGKDQQEQQKKQGKNEQQGQEKQDEQQDGQKNQQEPEQQQGGQEQKPEEKPQPQDKGQAQQNQEDKEQQDEAQQQQEAANRRPAAQSNDKKDAQMEAEEHKNEDQQANEQWLKRIPDDPGGLLRRKFLYQYQQRQGGGR
jgi:Ca-activated chloride channel family protein